jgi:hypothetical protein
MLNLGKINLESMIGRPNNRKSKTLLQINLKSYINISDLHEQTLLKNDF